MIKTPLQQFSIGDFAKVISGFAFKSSTFGIEGIPIVKISCIKNGYVDLSESEFVPEEFLEIDDKYHVRPGDILVSLTGSHLTQPNSVVGRIALYQSNLPEALLNQRAGKIIVDKPDKCDSLFLYYLLSTSEMRRNIALMASGAASQANVSPGQIESLKIIMPTLQIQRRIAAILSAYDDLIENNTRRIKILEEMARLIYREWFVEFRAPGVRLRKATPEEKKVTGKDVFPEGWDLVKYSDLLDSAAGGDWGEEEATEKEDAPVLVIRGTDFDEVRFGTELRSPLRFISSDSLEKRRLNAGDIIVENSVNAKSRCVGQTLLVTKGILNRNSEELIAASFCKVFRLKDPSLAPLVILHMKQMYETKEMEYYQNVATNGIGNFQSTKFVEKVRIALPNDKKSLGVFAAELAKMTNTTYADQNLNLRRTRDLLLPRLISGEVEV